MDSYNFGEKEIDSRPSDAIALALRVDAPVFVSETVMNEAGVKLTDQKDSEVFKIDASIIQQEYSLEEELKKAVDIENYELAAQLRDKIKSLNGENSGGHS